MTLKTKLVMLGINFACLGVTLIYPNSATPFAILPFIVAVSSWIFTVDESQRPLRSYIWYLLIAIILGVICLLTGMICDISYVTQLITFKKGTVLETLDGIHYAYFAVPVALALLGMSIIEVINSHKVMKGDSHDSSVGTNISYIDHKVNEILWR